MIRADRCTFGVAVSTLGLQGLVAKLTKFALESTPYGRDFVFKKAREGVHKQTNGNYPAPNKIIDVVEETMYGYTIFWRHFSAMPPHTRRVTCAVLLRPR